MKRICPECGHAEHWGGEYRVHYRIYTHENATRMIYKHFRKRQDAEGFIAALERHEAVSAGIDVRLVGDWEEVPR